MGYGPGNTALIEALKDPKDHVRYMAAKSLGIIGDPVSMEPLIERLHDENEFVRIDEFDLKLPREGRWQFRLNEAAQQGTRPTRRQPRATDASC